MFGFLYTYKKQKIIEKKLLDITKKLQKTRIKKITKNANKKRNSTKHAALSLLAGLRLKFLPTYSRTGKSYPNIFFCALTSPLFTEFLDLFYPCGKKIVPPNIGELLTARGLAYWAMDDGNKTGPGFRIATHSFTREEVGLSSLPLF